MIKIKNKKKDINKNFRNFAIFLLVLFFFFGSISNIKKTGEFAETGLVKANFAISTGIISLDTIGFLDLLGNSTLIMYQLYGQKSYEGILFIDSLGTKTIYTYQFVGQVFYRGIIETIFVYKNLFENFFAFDVDKSISQYTQNVLGGLNIVKESAKQNITKANNHLTQKNQKILENNSALVSNIKINDASNAFCKGMQKIKTNLHSATIRFYSNVEGNLKIIQEQSKYLKAEVISIIKP